MPSKTAIDEMRAEYRHRCIVRHVLETMTIDQINYVFLVHSGGNEPGLLGTLAREFYLDAIDDYLDDWYTIPR